MRTKSEIREFVWRILEERGVARFPKPIKGRIPNFLGAEQAAERLRRSEYYQRAKVVFCNPDSPQRPVREIVLRDGKTLVMATPRLRQGFILLREVPASFVRRASTIRGAFEFGKLVDPKDLDSIDVKITGSVAVSPDGGRVGKGKGYSDLEYGILGELGLIGPETPVLTTVHDLQIVKEIPREPHDMPVHLIFTPTRTIRTEARGEPKIRWDLITEELLEQIPLLRKLKGT